MLKSTSTRHGDTPALVPGSPITTPEMMLLDFLLIFTIQENPVLLLISASW